MTSVTVKLSARELELLTALASDQLFRREFIEPRFPGSKYNPIELDLGKKLVVRLKVITDRAKGISLAHRSGASF